MLEPTVAPYGAWQSLVRIDDVVGDVIVLGEPWIDGDDVYWLAGRAAHAGPARGVPRAACSPAPRGRFGACSPPPRPTARRPPCPPRRSTSGRVPTSTAAAPTSSAA